MLPYAAERGERRRVGTDALTTATEHIGRLLENNLTPPEARTAALEGQTKLDAGDFSGAERSFDEAIQLGLDDVRTVLGRGWSRMGLGRYADADADFDLVLADDYLDAGTAERGLGSYFRGIAREQREDLPGALADYGLAIELGQGGAGVFRRRARVYLALGDTSAARQDVASAKEAEPGDPDTFAVDGELLAAEGNLDAAVTAYDRALALERTAGVEFNRALALLLAGRRNEACDGYRRGVRIAGADEREQALAEIDRRATDEAGADACRKILA
jgi:tetratricopeptide (TPR) repeat protein